MSRSDVSGSRVFLLVRNAWIPSLAATVAYLVLVTDGFRIGPLPFGLLLVFLTLALWLPVATDVRDPDHYPLRMPLLALALAVPVVWTLVAIVHHLVTGNDSFEPTFIAQHAARFLYLLLFFPLCTLYSRFGQRAFAIVLVPVAGLCLVTVGIWIYHVISGDDMGTTQVFVFKGVIGSAPEGFRVFIANQIVFVLALAIFLSRAAAQRPGAPEVVLFLLLLAATWLSHTRGLWLALLSVSGTVLLLLFYLRLSPLMGRRFLVGIFLILLVGWIGWGAVVAGVLEGPFGDASTAKRVEQAPELLEGFRQNPVFGAGLGATLPSGFVRSEANPWSFELTYLQILFQMGLVGLVTLVALIGYSLVRGLRSLRGKTVDSLMALAGTASITGVMVGSATNPYLFSSFGMLILAFGFLMLVPPSLVSERKPA